jgi:hypothetical protein
MAKLRAPASVVTSSQPCHQRSPPAKRIPVPRPSSCSASVSLNRARQRPGEGCARLATGCGRSRHDPVRMTDGPDGETHAAEPQRVRRGSTRSDTTPIPLPSSPSGKRPRRRLGRKTNQRPRIPLRSRGICALVPQRHGVQPPRRLAFVLAGPQRRPSRRVIPCAAKRAPPGAAPRSSVWKTRSGGSCRRPHRVIPLERVRRAVAERGVSPARIVYHPSVKSNTFIRASAWLWNRSRSSSSHSSVAKKLSHIALS